MDEQKKRALRIGDSAQLTKKFTEDDIAVFAELTCDDNALHMDEAFSRRGLFRRPVVHGVMVGSLISSIAGTKLPGHGAVLQEMTCSYPNPVYPGDEVTARLVIKEIDEREKYYTVISEGVCCNQDQVTVAEVTCKHLLLKRFFEVIHN